MNLPPPHGVQDTIVQTIAQLLVKENERLATASHISSKKERLRKEKDYRETFDRDRARRDKVQPPAY